MAKEVVCLYFSPTHSSGLIGRLISEELAASLQCKMRSLNWTLPEARGTSPDLEKDAVLVFAFPVYGGRVPVVLQTALKGLKGAGCAAIPVAVYGNRAFDDSLAEASDILAAQGCRIAAGIAAIAQHALDPAIAHGRPDEGDKETLRQFGRQIAAKLAESGLAAPEIPGNRPYVELKPSPPITPLTSDACNYCGLCAKDCPVGVIDAQDEHIVNSGCIICGACITFCPQKAKAFPQPFVSAVQQMLAKVARERKEPQLFI